MTHMRGGVSVSLTHPLAVLVSLFFAMEGGGFPLNGARVGYFVCGLFLPKASLIPRFRWNFAGFSL